MPFITKRALDKKKKKLRHSKAEKKKSATVTLKDLTSLQDKVKALEKQINPKNANEIAIKKKRLQDANKLFANLQRENNEVNAKEKRVNAITLINNEEEIV